MLAVEVLHNGKTIKIHSLYQHTTQGWVKHGTTPGSINIPFTAFKDEDAVEIMEKQFNVFQGAALKFREAKTLVMFCNGNWCPQSPIAIRK